MSEFIEFGKSKTEIFNNIIITGVFVLIANLILRIMLLLTNPDPIFYEKYDLIFSGISAVIGFGMAQIFIKIDKRSRSRS